jgi:hypothetical protein
MFGLTVDFLTGAVAGAVLVVLVPKIGAWIKSKISK